MPSSSLLHSSYHSNLNQSKYGVYVIIVFLMAAIIVVSFYEPRWIHSGAFANRQTSLLLLSSTQQQAFEDVTDLRELISDASKRGKRSGALQTLPVEAQHLVYDSLKVSFRGFLVHAI